MKTKEHLLLALILAGALVIRVKDINQPFDTSLRGECNAYYTILANNHLIYGPLVTGLVPVINSMPVQKENFIYYEHHPPTMVALTSLVFAINGVSEFSARFLPVILSILTLGVLYFWVRRLSNQTAALLAAGMAAFTPMSAYFGPFLNFESFVIPPMLGALFFYFKWLKTAQPKHLKITLGLIAIGMLMDYVVLMVCFIMMADFLIFRRPGLKKIYALLFPFCGLVFFVLVKIWFHMQHSRFGSRDQEEIDFFAYLISITPLKADFDFTGLIRVVSSNMVHFFTWPVLALSVLGLVFLIKNLIKSKRLSLEIRSILILFTFAFANIIVFGGHALVHDYWIIYLYPGICWCAALGLQGVKPKSLVYCAAILVFGWGVYQTTALMDRRMGEHELYHRGLSYLELGEKNELLVPLMREPIQVTYYSQGRVFMVSPEIDDKDWYNKSAYALAKITASGYKGKPMLFVLRKELEGKANKEAMAWIREKTIEKHQGKFITFKPKDL